MNTVHKILSTSFIKTVKEYKNICNLLDPLIKQFWEEHQEEWKHFGHWDFSEDGEYIIVDYNYLDYYENWEWDQAGIPVDKIIKMINYK